MGCAPAAPQHYATAQKADESPVNFTGMTRMQTQGHTLDSSHGGSAPMTLAPQREDDANVVTSHAVGNGTGTIWHSYYYTIRTSFLPAVYTVAWIERRACVCVYSRALPRREIDLFQLIPIKGSPSHQGPPPPYKYSMNPPTARMPSIHGDPATAKQNTASSNP